MTNKYMLPGLTLIIFFQIAVLTGEYLTAVYPLWSGREIKLKTIPVDPRSYFRGNYARLRYQISTIPRTELGTAALPRQNEIIYIHLRETAGGLFEYAGISLQKPRDGLFIRGRVHYPHWQQGAQNLEILYGIEAWFRPMAEAATLEKALRSGGFASIKIAANGKAALLDVQPVNY